MYLLGYNKWTHVLRVYLSLFSKVPTQMTIHRLHLITLVCTMASLSPANQQTDSSVWNQNIMNTTRYKLLYLALHDTSLFCWLEKLCKRPSEVSCKAKHWSFLWVVFIMIWFHTDLSTCWFAGAREAMIQTSVISPSFPMISLALSSTLPFSSCSLFCNFVLSAPRLW